MCRLLAIVASEPTEFRIVLREAPRSLAALSQEHRDGWGLAIHDGGDWRIHRGVAQASEDEQFHRLAVGSCGVLLVAHVRNRTVGTISLDNTHPFQCGKWVFAHNGTINDVEYMRSAISPHRRAAIRGQTDSELFFAFLLTRIDERPGVDLDVVLADVVREARARPDFGAFNFLLSDGEVTYAHRYGRTLFLLERGPHDEVRTDRESRETGAIVQTHWSQRRRAVFVASERLTDEPWREVTSGMLLRLDALPTPRWRAVHVVPDEQAAPATVTAKSA
jgi:glutamine amidotransferase